MAWHALDDDIAREESAMSAWLPEGANANNNALLRDNGRACGRAYIEPMEIHPPSSSGGLGPLCIPIAVPRCTEVRVSVILSAASEVEVDLWWVTGDDDARHHGGAVTVDNEPQAFDFIAPMRPREWTKCGLGFSQIVDTVSFFADEHAALVLSEGVINRSAYGSEVVVDGRTRYVYADLGGGSSAFWPREVAAIHPQTVQHTPLVEVQIHGWSVECRDTSSHAPLAQGGSLTGASALPGQRSRAVAGWRARSHWYAAAVDAAAQNVTAPPSGVLARVAVPVHALTEGVSGVAIIGTIGATTTPAAISVTVEVDTLDGVTQIASTTGELAGVSGVAGMIAVAGGDDTACRDLILPGDLAALALVPVPAIALAPEARAVYRYTLTATATTPALLHRVAAVSLIEGLAVPFVPPPPPPVPPEFLVEPLAYGLAGTTPSVALGAPDGVVLDKLPTIAGTTPSVALGAPDGVELDEYEQELI